MQTIKQDTTLVNVSEFRNNAEKILKKVKETPVQVRLHNEPVAMMISMEEFDRLEALLEFVEDYGLAEIALERERKGGRYLSAEEVEKKLRFSK